MAWLSKNKHDVHDNESGKYFVLPPDIMNVLNEKYQPLIEPVTAELSLYCHCSLRQALCGNK